MRVMLLPSGSWRIHSVLTVAAKGALGMEGIVMLANVSRVPPSGACCGAGGAWAKRGELNEKKAAASSGREIGCVTPSRDRALLCHHYSIFTAVLSCVSLRLAVQEFFVPGHLDGFEFA